jgi:hypothetical protein
VPVCSILLAIPLVAQITLVHSVVTLTGPWRFTTGDNAAWADPHFDDAAWETVDLTPPSPDAHDSDVGLVGWVNGWGARGHARYTGYAWYRLRAIISAPAHDRLAVLGPLQVDDAYQLFINGHLAGESGGDFRGAHPVIYNTKPRLFALRASDTVVIAIRVWAGPRALADDPAGGGIRIAPALGEAADITARYHLQWLSKFNGYVVDAVEGLAFIPVAIIVLILMRADETNRGYIWLLAALLLFGVRRANQAFFFWLPYESLAMFEFLIGILVIPLMTGAWLMAWRAWFDVRQPGWIPAAIGVLVVLMAVAQSMHAAPFALTVRVLMAALLIYITVLGVRHQGRDGWLAVPAVLLVAMCLFPGELSLLHIQGIWFPFGVGVSRTQYAIAVLLLAMPALLVHRLLGSLIIIEGD